MQLCAYFKEKQGNASVSGIPGTIYFSVFYQILNSNNRMDDFVWYECIYPGKSSSFYTNIKTRAVEKDVPQSDPDSTKIRKFSNEDNFSQGYYLYISFFIG